jgi:hypothetical protein
MRNDEIFKKIVERLQKEGILNTRRKVRIQYVAGNEVLERYVAGQVGAKRRDMFSDFEEYANVTAIRPMSEYISKTPPNSVDFSADLFRVYFPIGRSGTVETILDTLYLNPDDKVTEKNKRKIKKIEKELREERSHS